MDIVKLKQISTINMGQSPKSESYNYEKDGLPFFQGKADFGEVYPTIRMYCNEPIKIAEKNDILMSVRAPVGDVNISNFACCIGRGLAGISPNSEVLYYKYLFYVLKYKKNEISNKGTGSTFKAINKGIIENIEIPLPDLQIQHKIADVLDKAQFLIDKRKEQIKECERLIEGLFDDMFKNYDESKNSQKELSKVCNFIDYRGKTPKKSTSGIPFITAKNIKKNKFSIDPQEFISQETYESIMTRGFPRVNDVVFTTEAPLGNVCRIPDIFDKFAVGQRIIVLQPLEGVLTSEYLEYALSTSRFRNKMFQRSTGSTVKGIRSKELIRIQIPIPPLELQIEFSNKVRKIEKQKQLLEKSLSLMEDNFNSIMQKAFRGELFS